MLKIVYHPKKAFISRTIWSFAYTIELVIMSTTDTTTRAICAFRKVCHLNYIKIFPFITSYQDKIITNTSKTSFISVSIFVKSEVGLKRKPIMRISVKLEILIKYFVIKNYNYMHITKY